MDESCNAPCGHPYSQHDEHLECTLCDCILFDCAPEQPGGLDVTPMPPDEVQDIQDFGIEKVTDPDPQSMQVEGLGLSPLGRARDQAMADKDVLFNRKFFLDIGESHRKVKDDDKLKSYALNNDEFYLNGHKMPCAIPDCDNYVHKRGVPPENLSDEDQKELIRSFEDGEVFPPLYAQPKDIGHSRGVVKAADVIVGIDWGSEEKDKSVTMLRMPDGTMHQIPCGTKDCATCRSVRYWQQSQAAAQHLAKTAHILNLTMVYPAVHNEYYHLEVVPAPAGQTEIRLPRKVGPHPEVKINGEPVSLSSLHGDNWIRLQKPIPEYGVVKIRWREPYAGETVGEGFMSPSHDEE